MAPVFRTAPDSRFALGPFPSIVSEPVPGISRPTGSDAILTMVAVGLLNSAAPIRWLLIERIVSETPDLRVRYRIARQWREHMLWVQSTWHPPFARRCPLQMIP